MDMWAISSDRVLPGVIFKAVLPSRISQGFGDIVWTSSSGRRAVLVDLVSGTFTFPDTVEKITELFQQYDCQLQADELLQKLDVFLKAMGSQAVAAVVDWHDDVFSCTWVGNPRLYKLSGNEIESLLGTPEIQPMSTLGMSEEIMPRTEHFAYDSNCVYWLTSDGLSLPALQQQHRTAFSADSEQSWRKLGETCNTGDDWSLIVFPVQLRADFRKESWPYDPFIGAQEGREHEKRGLAAIADALFSDPDFFGFRIVGSGAIERTNSTRMVDGYLVSPWGIVLLELKDHDVKIELDLAAHQMRVRGPQGWHKEKNPVNNVSEALRSFSSWDVGVKIGNELRNIAAIVFTNPLVQVNCITPDGEKTGLPHKHGNVLIGTPATIAQQIKSHVLKTVGKRKTAPISIEQVNQIVARFRGDENPSTNSSKASKRQIGKFSMDIDPIAGESTSYYMIYQGYNARGQRVWIKRFQRSALNRESLERNAQNLGREAEVLDELMLSEHVQRFQRYLGDEKNDEEVFIILEQVGGVRLDEWLEQNPDRTRRIQLLKQLAKSLSILAERNIVHRAISPHNIRIKDDDLPVVVNFEMCRLEHLSTLPISGRDALDRRFIAEETNHVGAQLSPACDTYSFGRLACLVLTNDLHFKDYADQRMVTRKKQFWSDLAQLAGVPAGDLQRLLSPNPHQRPVGQDLLTMVEQWQ